MSKQKTSRDTRSAISSRELVAGRSRSELPDGIQEDLFGVAPAPVNRSAQPGRGGARKTNDTCGQSSGGLSRKETPVLSSENRSQAKQGESGSVVNRKCNECGMLKPLSEYYQSKTSSGGYRTKCKECVKSREMEAKKRVPAAERSAKFKSYRKKNRAKALCSLAKHRAKKKGIQFSVRPDKIQARIDVGICELTGIPFNLDGGKTWDSPSLDRIDSSKGYTEDNVRVVLYCVNVMANVWGECKILDIADAIRAERSSRSSELQTRLEASLKRRLSKYVSPEYWLTWKRWDMESGPPICALRASVRRTSDNDCGGWPSPAVCDSASTRNSTANRKKFPPTGIHAGDTLTDAATKAGWPTPTAKEKAGGEYKDSQKALNRFLGPHANELRDVAKFTQPGATPTTSPAQMEKRGALNAELPRWLQGYPKEWCEAAILAHRSLQHQLKRG